MTAREVMAKLVREEWVQRPGKGSHVVFRKAGHGPVVVSNHRGDIPPGTLRSICKAAGWQYPPEA